ncbi:hypothetical protein ACJX0J_012279 [Zea mays]
MLDSSIGGDDQNILLTILLLYGQIRVVFLQEEEDKKEFDANVKDSELDTSQWIPWQWMKMTMMMSEIEDPRKILSFRIPYYGLIFLKFLFWGHTGIQMFLTKFQNQSTITIGRQQPVPICTFLQRLFTLYHVNSTAPTLFCVAYVNSTAATFYAVLGVAVQYSYMEEKNVDLVKFENSIQHIALHERWQPQTFALADQTKPMEQEIKRRKKGENLCREAMSIFDGIIIVYT